MSRCEIFRFAPNSDARARSGAFSRQVFYATRMSGILPLAFLVGYLRRIWPMCRRRRTYVRLHVVAVYFRSEPRINARRRNRSYFVNAFSVRVYDVGERNGIGIKQEVACSLPRLLV